MKEQKINLVLNNTGIGDDYPVRLMGVINISSGSFYKGSVYTPESIPEVAKMMIQNKASFLDIGGRSTAPHASPVTPGEEKERIISALERLFSSCDTMDIHISIDTQYREVAEAAFGAMQKYNKDKYFMLNDVSCLCTDPSLADWLCDIDKPVILMSARNKPGDSLGIKQTIEDLSRAIDTLSKKGFPVDKRVIIDPAIGRWIPEKHPRYDLEILARLEDFRVLLKPVLAGISRKSFIGSILNKKDPDMRYQGTLAATAIAVFNGAHIVRTHDITEETLDTVILAREIRNQRTRLLDLL
ncbi:MAG: dihydropteroate synthase [Spirochaetales bacterium]|nr:dihydropteroate synthase [Spirochaetales bacterium]